MPEPQLVILRAGPLGRSPTPPLLGILGAAAAPTAQRDLRFCWHHTVLPPLGNGDAVTPLAKSSQSVMPVMSHLFMTWILQVRQRQRQGQASQVLS